MPHPFDSLGHPHSYAIPRIRTITTTRCLEWLAAGWHDLTWTPIASLAYGLLFSLTGDVLLVSLWHSPQAFAVAISGFLIVAPLLSIGLFELSRRSESRKYSEFIDSLDVFSRNCEGLAVFGLLLATSWLAWAGISTLLISNLAPPDNTIASFFTQALGNNLFLAWCAVGFLLALTIFVLSVVSVPLLIDRHCNVFTACETSFLAFVANPIPLLIWAATIAFLTLIGFVTALIGLVILMPILAHASWHAYRDLVE